MDHSLTPDGQDSAAVPLTAPRPHPKTNIHYVNNTNADISDLLPYFAEAYKTGKLHEDVADLFTINILKGYNPDGTDRMIIEAAGRCSAD